MAGDGCVGKTSSTLIMRLFLVLTASICGIAHGDLTNTCSFQNCRWNVVREAVDNTKVTNEDNSEHKINWKWDVRGGHWDITYSYKYPEEYYSGKATFVNSSITGENAFVTWSSSDPWTSNAVPIYSATPWNISYNGDVFGFTPTTGGRYIFRIFTKNKRHDPFAASEPLTQPPVPCSLSSSDPALLGKWWQEQKLAKTCPEQALAWTWAGKSGNWRVFYRYVDSLKQTVCDVYYETPGISQIKVINWELDELRQSVSYATYPVRIYENGWQISLTPAETWGFTPTGNGLWAFQHFSRNMVFQPFSDYRGAVLYAVPVGAPVQPPYQTVNLPAVPAGAPLQPSYQTVNLPAVPAGAPLQPSYQTVNLPPVVPV